MKGSTHTCDEGYYTYMRWRVLHTHAMKGRYVVEFRRKVFRDFLLHLGDYFVPFALFCIIRCIRPRLFAENMRYKVVCFKRGCSMGFKMKVSGNIWRLFLDFRIVLLHSRQFSAHFARAGKKPSVGRAVTLKKYKGSPRPISTSPR